MDRLARLNQAQKQAVTHGEGPALVVAGAGSGKTRVLTCRLAYLIEHLGVDPYSILAITFTNKAAREMKQRCRNMVGEVVDYMWVSTFHSACLRILRSCADRAGYSRDFVVYGRSDQLAVVKDALKRLQLDPEQFDHKSVLNRISRAKNDLKGPGDLRGDRSDFYQQKVADVYQIYQEQLREYNAMDFGDLLLVTFGILRECDDVLMHYREKFKHILVDEYQDTNHAQYRLLKLLAEPERNVFAVGDSDQSIYSWRGADLSNILEFEGDYPEASVYKLEENYRSTQPILDAAQRVIRRNAHRQPKRLWTQKEGGEPVSYFCAASGEKEARFVVSYIQQLVDEESHRWADFAVMYRTNAQSRLFEDCCRANNVPFRMLGDTSFYDREEIRDSLAMLRLLCNPDDWKALERVINKPRRSVGDVTVQRLRDFGESDSLDVHQVLACVEEVPRLRSPQRRGVEEFARSLRAVQDRLAGLEPADVLRMMLQETGYYDYIDNRAQTQNEAREREANLEELVGFARSLVRRLDRGEVAGAEDISRRGEDALQAFVQEEQLRSGNDDQGEDAAGVTLMTLHSAKGLEFPVVFIVGMEEGLLPHSRSIGEPRQLEEERRLCYVGMTRAKQKLILSLAEERMLYGEYSRRKPSRFLEEIGTENMQSMRPSGPFISRYGQKVSRSTTLRDAAAQKTAASAGDEQPDWDDYVPGSRIRHRVWGEGRIVARDRKGGDLELSLSFPQKGIKTVVAAHAPIELLNEPQNRNGGQV